MANNFAGDTNCKAWWQFEPGDAFLIDTQGGNDLTSTGSPAPNTLYHKEGLSSADFAGAPDKLSISDADLDAGFPLKTGDATKQISICHWVRWDSLDHVSYLPCFRYGLSTAPYDSAVPDNPLYFAISWQYGVLSVEVHATTLAPVAGRWYHIGATYNDADKSYRLRVYDSVSGTVTQITGTGTNNIGAGLIGLSVGYWGAAESYMEGQVDELVVFDDILTADEIDSIRNGTYVSELPWGGTIAATTSLSAPDLNVTTLAPWFGVAAWPIKETLRFNTEILQSHDRTEQRIAKRQGIPRQQIVIPFILRSHAEAAEWDNYVHTWAKLAWPVPIWWEAERHAANLAAGTGSITVDTTCADYRDGSYAIIYQRGKAELVEIASKTDTSLTLARNTVNAYSGDKWIMPARAGVLAREPRTVKRVGGAALVEMEFLTQDNDTAIAGWAAPAAYDGLDVLTDPSYMDPDSLDVRHDPDMAVLDAGTGTFETVSNSDFNEVKQDHNWVLQSKAAVWAFRQLCHAKKGRQGVFLVPTFGEDIVLSRPMAAMDTTLYAVNRGYAQMGLNTLRTYLAFRPAGGAIIVRKVTGISAVSASEESMTINSAPVASAFGAGAALCWVDRCRFASDDITVIHRRRGLAKVSAQLTRVSA